MDEKRREQTYHHMRGAIAKLSEYALPATPPNYAVCYELVSGENAELHEKVAKITADSGGLDDSDTEDLFYNYVLRLNEQYLHKVQDDVLRLLDGVSTSLEAIHKDSGAFDAKLRAQGEALNNNATLQALSKIITILGEGTKEMQNSSAAAREKISTNIAEAQKLKLDLEQAKKEASVDFLTGLFNRKAFNGALQELIGAEEEKSEGLCLLLIDIDHFKLFNDRFGHLIGDKVLSYVANTMKNGIRGTDVIARFGGEEFSILLPNTNYQGSMVVAEQVRKTIASTRLLNSFSREALPSIQVSVGVSSYRKNEGDESFIDRADRALYLAKRLGRNRVSGEEEL